MFRNCTGNQTTSVAHAVSYGVVMLAGMPLNGLCLWILLRRHGLRSPNTVLLANLALSDFVLAFSLPLRIYYHATATWPLGALACTICLGLFHINLFTSAVFVTLICVDRLLAVVFPLRSRVLRTPRISGIASAVTWVLFMLCNVPLSLDYMKELDACKIVCFQISKVMDTYILIYSIFIFVLFSVLVVCTAMIMRTLGSLRTEPPAGDKRRVMLMFGVNLFMFAVFFMPFATVLFIRSINEKEITPQALSWAACFASFNLCFDPLIYYFSIDALWKGLSGRNVDSQGS